MNVNECYMLFDTFTATLKETSKDDTKHQYMTESLLDVISFDKVKLKYAEERHLVDKPHSCDAIYLDNNGELNFIEFKNSKNKRKIKEMEIKEKVYESILMFLDKTDKRISEIAENVNFILVYNKEALEKNTKNKYLDSKDISSFKEIEGEFTDFAKTHIIHFNLESLKNFCFKEVYTLNREEFEEHLKNICPSEQTQ